jgi:hypothetical protein
VLLVSNTAAVPWRVSVQLVLDMLSNQFFVQLVLPCLQFLALLAAPAPN